MGITAISTFVAAFLSLHSHWNRPRLEISGFLKHSYDEQTTDFFGNVERRGKIGIAKNCQGKLKLLILK